MDESLRPEAVKRNDVAGPGVGNQQHEAEDWLGHQVKDTISVNLSINAQLAVSVTEDPDNWVKSPENQGERGKSDKELASRGGAGSSRLTSTESDLVDEDEVADPGNDIVSPLLELVVVVGEACKHAGQDHDQVGEDNDDDVVAVQASQEGKVHEEKWSGDGPVDIAGPQEVTVDVLGVVDAGHLVVAVVVNVVDGDTVVGGHGEVRDGSGGGDEGGDDVEETLLLYMLSVCGSICISRAWMERYVQLGVSMPFR